MRTLPASQQKLLKSFHLVFASIWLACVVVLLGMGLTASRIVNGDELYMFNYIYHLVDLKILTPAAVATLLTGLIYSLFTRWGFVKHGWIVYKWIVTVVIVVSGTIYLGPLVEKMLEITDSQRANALLDPTYATGIRVGIWASGINTILLLIAVFVSVYKPWKNLRK